MQMMSLHRLQLVKGEGHLQSQKAIDDRQTSFCSFETLRKLTAPRPAGHDDTGTRLLSFSVNPIANVALA